MSWGLDPAPVPNAGLPRVQLDPCACLQHGVHDVVQRSRSLWKRQDVRVIQKRKQVFTWSHPALACRQCVVHTQTEQQGHERVPLLTAFALPDVVADPLVVLPHVCGGLRVSKSCEWQEAL